MKIRHKFIIVLISGILILLFSCNTQNQRKDYLTFIEEIHKIECEHLNRDNVVLSDTSDYNFRSVAFQHIMNNSDRRVLAHYEDLCAKVASIVDFMDENQKKIYENDVRLEYSIRCK